MLSKSSAKKFFLGGTALCVLAFGLLTIDTFQRIPERTRQAELTDAVARGKGLWDSNNCMGCHTLLGEGAYYAPELTKVYERRGPLFIEAMLRDPQAMYPGQRKMVNYRFKEEEIQDLVAFFKWIGGIDTNGFPPKPNLTEVVSISSKDPSQGVVASSTNRPKVFNQICIACHSLNGQGGNVGPALDGVGDRFSREGIVDWLHDPSKVRPNAKMPKLPLSEEDITELAAFLSQLKAGVK